MFPAILDLSVLKTAVVGSGSAAVRRLHLLEEAGARNLRVFSTDPELARVATGQDLKCRLPVEAEIAALHLVFTAGLPEADAGRIGAWAREHGTLINTEDVRPLCDFHVPAMVRRGDLLLTVSTGGQSPGLARRLRRELERSFSSEWGERLGAIAEARNAWRAEGISIDELTRRSESMIDEKGWLR